MRQGFAIGTAFLPSEIVQSVRFVANGRPKPSFHHRMNPGRRERIKSQKSWRQPLAIALVLLLGLGLRRKKDHEAFAFGFVPFFLMATASYYYYVVRGTLVVMHAGALHKGRNAMGLGMLFAIEALTNWIQQTEKDWRIIQIGWMSWGLILYVVVMVIWLNWESLKVDLERFRARRSSKPDSHSSDAESAALSASRAGASEPS
jgi:hypothetical protein